MSKQKLNPLSWLALVLLVPRLALAVPHTATPTMTGTDTPTGSDTPTVTDTFTATATSTSTDTPTSTSTNTPTASNTDTASPTATSTFTPIPSGNNVYLRNSQTVGVAFGSDTVRDALMVDRKS